MTTPGLQLDVLGRELRRLERTINVAASTHAIDAAVDVIARHLDRLGLPVEAGRLVQTYLHSDESQHIS